MIILITVNYTDGTVIHPDQKFKNYEELEKHVEHNYKGFSSLVITVLP